MSFPVTISSDGISSFSSFRRGPRFHVAAESSGGYPGIYLGGFVSHTKDGHGLDDFLCETLIISSYAGHDKSAMSTAPAIPSIWCLHLLVLSTEIMTVMDDRRYTAVRLTSSERIAGLGVVLRRRVIQLPSKGR